MHFTNRSSSSLVAAGRVARGLGLAALLASSLVTTTAAQPGGNGPCSSHAALAVATGVPLALLAPQDGEAEAISAVAARHVYTAAGEPVADGVVTIADGKIAGVAPGTADLVVDAITPGLVDLSVRIDTGEYSVEQTDETPAHLSVADALDLFSYRWDRELRSGVTTVLATPQDQAVIGGYGVVLKTGGAPTLDARLVKDHAVLRGSMGDQPSAGNRTPRGSRPATFYYRRPTTRMGVEWVARDAFWDAVNARKRGDLGAGAEREKNETLLKVIDGELPFSVQAWATQDIRTAIYLKEEFGIPNMFVDAAAEAWREPEMLVRSGLGVVLPPYVWNGRTQDSAWYALDTAKELADLGVTFALSGHGTTEFARRLAYQPGFAMRGGLSFEEALAAVTINPARMVGVDDRVGSLEAGKDADLVLWSGTPFEPTARVVGVVLGGRLVVDPRAASDGE